MKHKCPVCGKHEFIEIGSFEICPVCGWEDDNLQGDDHNYAGGANDLSVNEARIEFFLLSKDSTQDEAHRCQNAYLQESAAIRKRYAKADRVKEPDKAEQEILDYRSARKAYMNALNAILQAAFCNR